MSKVIPSTMKLAIKSVGNKWKEKIIWNILFSLGFVLMMKKIKQTAETKVEKVINEIIKGDVIEALTGNRHNSNYEYSRSLRELVNDTMEKFCNDNKDVIINLAADRLVEKLARTKAVKEATERVLREMENK